MEPRPSRQAKDHVFADMFNQPKYRLELFKALHPEATDITEVESRASAKFCIQNKKNSTL